MGRFSSKNKGNSNSAVAEQEVNESMEGTKMTDVFDEDGFDAVEPEVTEEVAEVVQENTEPEVADISGFIGMIDSLVEREENGDVAEVSPEQIRSVQEAYKALERKAKNKAKNAVSDLMEKAVIEDNDLALARFYLEINNRMVETTKVAKVAAEKKVADPTESLVKLVAKLDLARALVKIPAEFDADDIQRRAGELFEKGATDAQSDEPELVWVKQAIKLAAPGSKSVVSGTRTRHSVAEHIAEAFADAAPGESLTVNQIVAFKSKEYGEDQPSKQAVIAHLTSKKFQSATAVSVSTDDNGETVLIKK